MSWQNLNVINGINLFEAYKKKYGSSSDYQKDQKTFWSHPEIQTSFRKSLSWLKLKSGDRVLDIGINNGYDIELLNKGFEKSLLDSLKLIGFDLADDSLKEACKKYYSKNNDWKFVRGDITSFSGVNICDGHNVEIVENSTDVVIALASLQSSSLIEKFDNFIIDLVKKLSKGSQLFIGLPNFHIDDSKNVVLGLYDAKQKKVDYSSCSELSDRLTQSLERLGFRSKKVGELIVFYYFYLE